MEGAVYAKRNNRGELIDREALKLGQESASRGKHCSLVSMAQPKFQLMKAAGGMFSNNSRTAGHRPAGWKYKRGAGSSRSRFE